MEKSKRKFSAEFKLKVALEALQERESMKSLCLRYSLSPNQINEWNKRLKASGASVFGRERASSEDSDKRLIAELYRQIGELKVDCDFLKKKLQ